MANEMSEGPVFDMAAAERDARLIHHLRTAGVAEHAPDIRAAFGRLDAACDVLGQQDLVRVGLAFNGVSSLKELRARVQGGTADGNT